jgi:hypothetical protein
VVGRRRPRPDRRRPLHPALAQHRRPRQRRHPRGRHQQARPTRLLEIAATWGSTATNAPATQTTITWELDPDGDHTLLHFTNTIPGSPAQDGTTDPGTTTAAGWHLHLDALAAVLAGDQVDIAHPEPLFEPIHQAYTQKYGSGSE